MVLTLDNLGKWIADELKNQNISRSEMSKRLNLERERFVSWEKHGVVPNLLNLEAVVYELGYETYIDGIQIDLGEISKWFRKLMKPGEYYKEFAARVGFTNLWVAYNAANYGKIRTRDLFKFIERHGHVLEVRKKDE